MNKTEQYSTFHDNICLKVLLAVEFYSQLPIGDSIN